MAVRGAVYARTVPRPRLGCYPGSFDPPTIAHLAIARAARDQCALDRVDLVLSHIALGKEDRADRFADRHRAAVDLATRAGDWLGVAVSPHQLIADLAVGYDVIIVGADKWAQVCDPRWYGGSPEARDAALARLPHVAFVPRAPFPTPSPVPPGLTVLDLPADLAWEEVSSTAVRSGADHWRA